MQESKAFYSELIGTFILVFVGCGVVATSVLWNLPSSLLGISVVWGIGVTLAIFSVRKTGPAHLNPAVSLALWIYKPFAFRTLVGYILFQLIGAFLAGVAVYLIFHQAIFEFEVQHQILRGGSESVQTGKIFGEFYHQFDRPNDEQLSTVGAMLAEFGGTFVLVGMIFLLMRKKRLNPNLLPPLIGLTVTLIILIVAPFTQAGLNPARDFGPRLVAAMQGWGSAAFPPVSMGFFTVYILAPFLGGIFAALLFRFIRIYQLRKV